MKEVWKIYGINGGVFGIEIALIAVSKNFDTEQDAVSFAANDDYLKTRNIMILKT